MNYFVHPSSDVEEGVTIGEDTRIWHFCHVFSGAVLGRGCRIGQNVVIHKTVRLGDNVKVQNNVSLYDGVTLEDDVFCGPSCVFTNVRNPRAAVPRNTTEDFEQTLVRQGATIGANATIVCGVTLGRYCFVGAGSVVTRDVKDYQRVWGNPAHPNGWVCECGCALQFEQGAAICSECSAKYRLRDEQVSRQDESSGE